MEPVPDACSARIDMLGTGAGSPAGRQPLVDGAGRPIRSVRISVDTGCSLSCPYCHNEGNGGGGTSMGLEELVSIAGVLAAMGIRRVKLTGGEPLERTDIIEIVRALAGLFEEVSMTTNGVLLASLAGPLREAGLARVNVTLNSRQPQRYARICGHDRLTEVVAGIDAALEAGLAPVKLNMVLLRGINDDEVDDMLSFAAARGAVLQLIELEEGRAVVPSRFFAEHHVDMAAVEGRLKTVGRDIGANPLHNRRRYVLGRTPAGDPLPAPVEVEVVAPMHSTTFCANCTRIRLTADGRVKGCLFDDGGWEDLLGPLRAGAPGEELARRIRRVVADRRPYWTEEGGAGSTGPSGA